MPSNTSLNGWSRVASGLDIEVQHGVPVRISNTKISGSRKTEEFNETSVTDKIFELTGFNVSMHDWMSVTADEQEWSVCIDKKEFTEVLKCLAISSAAMFVDRFHKAIDHNAVDWDNAEYNYDFNQAVVHCCIPHGSLNKDHYFEQYIKTMHEESIRLIDDGISPMVEAE